MSSAITNAVNGIPRSDHYDENLCSSIKSKLDKSLRENYSLDERQEWGAKNLYYADKWEKALGPGIGQCLKEYFQSKALWAPKFDPRFPNQNQARNCFVNFVDYQRCLKIKGQDAKECDYFKNVSNNLCPSAWVSKWNDQLAEGSFPTDI